LLGKEDAPEDYRVRVSAPAHLHIGNYELSYAFGRILGTIGVTIAYPRTTVVACPSSKLAYSGPERQIAERVLEALNAGSADIKVESAIPVGVGLGGTTALALSLAIALAGLRGEGLQRGDIERIARELERGTWSALGVYSIMYGGLVVDSGRRGSSPPKLLARIPLPSTWRVLVVILKGHRNRIRELKRREDEILRNLKPASEDFTSRLAHRALSGILSCAAEGDLACFLKASFEFNRVLGDYWREHGQEHAYCCEEALEAVRVLEECCGSPLIQSSWGPALWTLAGSLESAARMRDAVLEWARARGIELEVFLTRPDNTGATAEPGDVIGWRCA